MIELKQSRRKPCIILILYVLAWYAVLLNGLEGWGQLLVIAGWLVLMLHWISGSGVESIEAMLCSAHGWKLQKDGQMITGLSLLPSSALTVFGLAIHLKSRTKRYFIWVAPDQCSRSSYKRLIRWMRYGPAKYI